MKKLFGADKHGRLFDNGDGCPRGSAEVANSRPGTDRARVISIDGVKD